MEGESDERRREVREVWELKADFWDAGMGEAGNDFQRLLVDPAAERLLAVRPGERVLDIACGNGGFSRKLARLGAMVTAVDFSENFLRLARGRTGESEAVEYRCVNATDVRALVALGEASYEAAVCNMALMDISEIGPLLEALPRLLVAGGRFVFTVQHPCFNSNAMTMVAELEDRDGEPVAANSVKLSGYLNVPPGKGAGMPGEPAAHYYFHRPLSELLGACFRAGFVMDGIEEPAFDEEDSSTLSWRSYREIPPVFAARLRLAG